LHATESRRVVQGRELVLGSAGQGTIPQNQRRVRQAPDTAAQGRAERPALKVLYLAIRNLDEYRGPTVGTRSSGWKQALQAFTIYFEGRIPTA
jgi:hypothetical protein